MPSTLAQLQDIESLLTSRLSDVAGRRGLRCVAVRVPRLRAERFASAANAHEDAWYYSAGSDSECAGLGVVERLLANGEERFSVMDRAVHDLWSRVELDASDAGTPPPRLVGGFAFQADRAVEQPWAEFGAAQFILPRVTYTRAGDESWLTLAVRASEVATAEERRHWVNLVLELVEGIKIDGDVASAAEPATVREIREGDRLEWMTAMQSIRGAIERGEMQKVVLARRVIVRFDRAIAPCRVLLALGEGDASAARFAFRVQGSTFVGAPPERLLAKRGLSIETEAVAGSVLATPQPDAERRLLGSAKLRAEQSPVVADLAVRLGEYADLKPIPDTPLSHVARGVMHLRTPISGTLRSPIRALRLLESIHPTPAVGGDPTRLALEWIRQNETHERGWYSAPVGWIDMHDDAEFSVALRSGVLVGQLAYLYAGAGIVLDSDADAELEETRWKLNVLLQAFAHTSIPSASGRSV